MSSKLKILFVDDDIPVTQGLKRMLHRMRKEWDMQFVNSGSEALDILKSEEIHVIVADMRMPGMNGAELLTIVRDQHPQIARIILSGYSDRDLVMQTVLVAHQFLTKPCDPEVLQNTIARILHLRHLMEKEDLLKLVTGIGRLPTLPSLYNEINRELSSPDPSIEAIIKKIEQDPAISIKILQLVNSGFFGLPQRITQVGEAARLLGVEILQSVILFSSFNETSAKDEEPAVSYEILSQHCILVGKLALQVCQIIGIEGLAAKEAFTAGILHDMGKLVFVKYRNSQYRDIIKLISMDGSSLASAEERFFGVNHGELGSYLLSLWGLPSSLVEAVAFHHKPSNSVSREIGTLSAVHIADVLANWDLSPEKRPTLESFDKTYIKAVGLSDKIEDCIQIRESMGQLCPS